MIFILNMVDIKNGVITPTFVVINPKLRENYSVYRISTKDSIFERN